MSKRAASAGALRFFKLHTLGDGDDPDLCILGNFIKGIEMDSWRIGEGAPVSDILPKDARIYMDKENLGIQLSSLIGNTQNIRKKMKGAPPLFRIDKDSSTYVLNFELAKELSEGDISNLMVRELPFSDDA